MQSLGLHLVGITPPEIAEAVPLVVSAIEPDHEESTGLEKLGESLDGSFAIRGVVKHADAIDDVEAFRRKGQSEYIGLEGDKVAVGYRFLGDDNYPMNPELDTLFKDGSGQDCGTRRILFRSPAFKIDNSDIGDLLRQISRCAANQ